MAQQSVRSDLFDALARMFGSDSLTSGGVGSRSGVLNIPDYKPTAVDLAYQNREPATPTPNPLAGMGMDVGRDPAEGAPSQQPAPKSGTGDPAYDQQIRDMRAARYYASLDGPARGNSSMGPLFGSLVGNQLGGFLNYGRNLDTQYNSPFGAYGQLQQAATAQRPYAAQERIASMNNETEQKKIGLAARLFDSTLSNAQNTKPLAGVATDYGAGVAVPYEAGPSNWRKFRRSANAG